MGKAKGKGKAARCPMDSCRTMLQGTNNILCNSCKKYFCSEHQYSSDHGCLKMAKKSSQDQSGIVFGKEKNAKKKEVKDSKKEKSNTDKEADDKLLANLLKADAKDLVKELQIFGSSSSRYADSTVVQAMSSDSKAVKNAFFGPIIQCMIEEAKVEKQLEPLCSLLKHQVTIASKLNNKSTREEKRSLGLTNVYGLFLDSIDNDSKTKENLMEFALETLIVASDKLSKSIAFDLLQRGVQVKLSQRVSSDLETFYVDELKPVLKSLCEKAQKASEDDDVTRNGASYAIASIVYVLKPAICAQDILDNIEGSLKKPKNTCEILGTMRIILQCCKDVGTSFCPYLVKDEWLSKILLNVFDKVAQSARSAIKKALTSFMDKVDERGVRLSVPILLGGLEENSWRIKQISLHLIATFGKRKARQLFRELPTMVPIVMECVKDTKKQVSEGAEATLDAIGSMITNSETVKLMPWLLDALKDPTKVDACLDELMDTTFVNSIDAQSLSLIIPIVLRGLREGSAELKLKAATTTGNVCSLVADVHDIRPFYSSLMPELKKLTDHSMPRVRNLATNAKESLSSDMKLTRRSSSNGTSHISTSDNGFVSAKATKYLNENIESLFKDETLIFGKLLKDYITQASSTILFDMLEDTDENIPRDMVLKALVEIVEDTIQPLLFGIHKTEAEFTKKELNLLTKQISETIVNSLWIAQGKKIGSTTDNSNEKKYYVYLPSIILAFASRLLLKRTGLFLEQNKRYTIVGMNGVGKTTLLNRIAARDIDGFPNDISVYYVEHEIMEEDAELSVIGYMHRDLDETVNKKSKKSKKEKAQELEERGKRVKSALDEVGFSEELANKPVASLSGGWRMRLAIARSMLYNASLLLLDEPTNHLDTEAIEWLRNYLCSLTTTTILLVSHDYDFVDYVSTDIIHLANLKLENFACTFKEFQKLNPSIVAALPKKDDSGPSGLDMLAAAAKGDSSAASLASNIKPIKFPEGCKLKDVTNRGKPIASLKNVAFTYPNTDKQIFKDVTVTLTQNSRVALLGKNGAGKTTLLKLLVGEVELDDEIDSGKVWKHHNLRSAYIAQHSMHHLEESIELTPCEYIQKRFWEGQDKEADKFIVTSLTPQDKSTMNQIGEICEIRSRVNRGKKIFYEIVKTQRGSSGATNHRREMADKIYRSREELERLGKDKPHIIKLVRLYDEHLKMVDSGTDLIPLTTQNMIKHLKDFGIDSEIAQRKIRWMSGGQKSRLCLAAAAWIRPHVIILDEPTNYLDNESLSALTYALKTFRGGVLMISHHEGFVGSLAKQKWNLADGKIEVVDVVENPNGSNTPPVTPPSTPPLPPS